MFCCFLNYDDDDEEEEEAARWGRIVKRGPDGTLKDFLGVLLGLSWGPPGSLLEPLRSPPTVFWPLLGLQEGPQRTPRDLKSAPKGPEDGPAGCHFPGR